jgi:hypothetical protein
MAPTRVNRITWKRRAPIASFSTSDHMFTGFRWIFGLRVERPTSKITAWPNNLCGSRSLNHALKTQGLNRVVTLLLLNLGARLGWVANTMPQPLCPPEITPVPLYTRLGGPQGQSGRMRNNENCVPSTLQAVWSFYTDCAIKGLYY